MRLTQRQPLCSRLPSKFLRVDIALLRVHHGNEAHALTDRVMGKRLECRYCNQGNVQSIRHHLCRRQSDAQPRERTGPDADGNALKLIFFHARHLERRPDVRHERLGVGQRALHTQFCRDALR